MAVQLEGEYFGSTKGGTLISVIGSQRGMNGEKMGLTRVLQRTST